MDSSTKRDSTRKILVFSFAIFISIFLLIIGIVLICIRFETGSTISVDYTDCTDNSAVQKMCKERVGPEKKPSCICFVPITINEPILAPVNVYYELPDYDQTRSDYAISKDAEQLSGKLSMVPAASCGNFSYQDTPEGKKPIAPCGEIADSMFIDQFTPIYNSSVVPALQTGLSGLTDEDKKLYHNPPGDLQAAFKDFARPKSWNINVTGLDITDPNNNGFQNERFIGWMKTDLTMKPALRINQTGIFETGLPAGDYQLRVLYYPSNYTIGRRIAIISSGLMITNYAKLTAGIILILLAICIIIGTVAYYKLTHGSYIPCETHSNN